MGRTKRKRKKRETYIKSNDLFKVINLQKELKLKCPNIKINYFKETGWGVKCKKKIEEGGVLISLPLSQLITTDVNCEVFSVLKFQNEPAQFVLSAFLTYESHLKEKSKYFQYIKSLPTSFTNPYFCTDNEIRLLPEFIRKEVIGQISYIDNIIKQLLQIVNDKSCPHCGQPLKAIFTRENFTWAWFTVNTRSVYYEDEKHANSLALAPFLDLFNHSNDAVTKMIIDFQNGLYVLKTLISYKKSEQVFIKYGAHSNLKLFLEYGFTLQENSNDFVEFSFQEVIESVKEFDFNLGQDCKTNIWIRNKCLKVLSYTSKLQSSFCNNLNSLQFNKKSNVLTVKGEITKLKYKFIKSNKLNENLTKGQEFSWNFLGLIYVLTTKDQDLSVLQAKTYSNDFKPSEEEVIKKICDIASEKKFNKLKESLLKIQDVEDCTEGLQVAKNLIKGYLNLLQKS